MFRKIGQYTNRIFLFIVILVAFYAYLYQVSRPTIIFHTYVELGFIGKITLINGSLDKLYTDGDGIATYRLPHIKDWKEGDEMALFTHNYYDIYTKDNVDFWIEDIYWDENGRYKSHSRNYNIMKQFSNVKFMYPIWGMFALLLLSIYLYIRNKISVTIFWLFVFVLVYFSPLIIGILRYLLRI